MSENATSIGWPTVSFGEFASLRNGLNFDRNGAGDPVRIVGVGDFQQRAAIYSVDELEAVKPNQPLGSDDLLRLGDLLFVRSNGNKALIGRCLSIEIDERAPVTFSGFTIRARITDQRLDQRYAKRLFSSSVFKNRLHTEGGGSNISNLNQRTLEGFEFALPPLPEQRRIAAVLDAWDGAIATAERLVAAKRRRRDGTLAEVFAPAVNETASDTWSTMPISELADVVGGGTPSTTDEAFWGGDVPWCTPTDVTALASRYIEQTERTITESALRASAAELLPPNSIVLCSRASVGECAINTVPMATNQGFQSLVPHRPGDALFLFYLVRAIKRRLLRVSAGSTFLEFGRGELRKLTVAAPGDNERTKIGETFAFIDDDIDATETLAQALRTQKRGLMQKLLTGEWRVPESIDALVPEGAARDAAE